MPRKRDPLDTSLIRLCSLAEQTTVLLRDVPPARDGFEAFRFDPDGLVAELTTLAARGRALHSDRLDAHREADTAADEGRRAAQAAYAAQTGFRRRLAAAAVMLDDPTADADLADTRRRLDLGKPRLTGALDLYRRLRDHLARPDHPARRHAASASIPAEVHALVRRLETAFTAWDDTRRTRREAVRRADEARDALRATLRTIRQMGEVAATRPDVPASLFAYLQPRPAGAPRSGPEPTHDPATSTHEPAATTHACADPTHDPATTTHEGADPTPDPAESTHAGAIRRNLDSQPCPDRPDP